MFDFLNGFIDFIVDSGNAYLISALIIWVFLFWFLVGSICKKVFGGYV